MSEILFNIYSLGIYPNCKCEHQDHIFSAYINECYIECGGDSNGLHPDCDCNELGTYYDPEEFICRSNVGRKCPENSIGIGPDCLCIEEDFRFYDSMWSCLRAESAYSSNAQCPEGGNKWPQCNVEIQRNVIISLIG